MAKFNDGKGSEAMNRGESTAAPEGQVGTPAPEAGQPGSLRARLMPHLKRYGWPLLCLFQLGLAAGAYQFGSRLASPPPPVVHRLPPRIEKIQVKPGARPEPVLEAEPDSVPMLDVLDEVDRLIRAGRYELALARCRTFADKAVAPLREAFGYRLGLCLEGLGRWGSALEAYRWVASRSGVARLAGAAQLGQARVWLRTGRPVESKALLCNLILRSGQPALRGQPFLADTHYLLGMAMTQEALGSGLPGPFDDRPVRQSASDWPLDRALDWGKVPAGPDPVPPPRGEDVIAVRRSGPRAEDAIVRLSVTQMPVAGALDRLAEQGKLRLEWTAAARGVVEGRTLGAELDGLLLPAVLRALAEPLGLAWRLEGERLQISADAEAEGAARAAHRLGAARQAVQEASRAFPGHELTPAAYLELGNLEGAGGKPTEAAAWYGRLVREWSRSPLAVPAHYNLGLLHHRAGEREAARQAFYRVVDRAPGHELAPLSYWRIGRLHLEDGDAEQAVSPLRRALVGAPGAPGRAAAAVTMASAYLLTNNPRAANAVLMEHRDAVNHVDYRSAASFLDTLARFRSSTDRHQRQREASDLLTCLLTLSDDRTLGPCGLLLKGQAYQELGMVESMVQLYEKALPWLRGSLAADVSFALAESYYAAERYEAATKLYLSLASGRGAAWVGRVRLRLAAIALHRNKPQDCLKWCREALHGKDRAEAAEVLRLMAGAYEQTGERDKMIRCLAGELPN